MRLQRTRSACAGIVSEVCWDVAPEPQVATGDTDACLAQLERVVSALPFRGPGISGPVVGRSRHPGHGQRVSDRLISRRKAIADRHGLVFYMHQSFGDLDTDRFREHAGGLTACAYLDQLGVLDDRLQLIHMIRTDPAKCHSWPRAGTHVVHCPAASTRVGMGVSGSAASRRCWPPG